VYSKKSNPQLNILLNVKQNDLMIQIKDNGTGIKRENLDKVFNMFYKASDMSRGNGLGLYIVKNALLLLDGEIHLSSVENEYTSVEIHIPEFKKNTHAVRRS
jgi:signal transduction histidine kinase